MASGMKPNPNCPEPGEVLWGHHTTVTLAVRVVTAAVTAGECGTPAGVHNIPVTS